MKEAHGPKPKVSRYGMPIRKQMIRDDNGEQPSGMVILKLKLKEKAATAPSVRARSSLTPEQSLARTT